ncbi:origin recognition complex subunit 2 [Chironomus tepperi]|uniref:origin recognition complex subunit 2 n=1 Tax=Chironomus tepperi TaxID=113505 RepID=UPI00391F75B9
MDTPQESRRKSARLRQSVNYVESPQNSPHPSTSKKDTKGNLINTPKTPKRDVQKDEETKTPSRRSRKATVEDPENFSPKKLRNNRTPSAKSLESIVDENSPTINQLDSTKRKSLRTKTPNKKFEDFDTSMTSRSRKSDVAKQEESIEVIDVDDSSSDESDDKENVVTKPTTLFDEEQDVEGEKLYSFKTPKKKDAMSNLANLTPKTPRHHDPNKTTPRTPKNSRIADIQKTPTSRPSAGKCTKTPRHVRDEIKKKLYKVKYQESEDEGDFSPDESDFEPSSSSASSDESESEKEEEAPPKKAQSVAARVLKTPSVATSTVSGRATRASTRNKTSDYQYVLQSDDFFSTQTAKSKTSDHTLDKLKNPRLPHDKLIKLLSEMEISKEHAQAVKEMNEEYKAYFNKWMILFDQGFTVLLHGLGSKRNLLHAFHQEKLSKEHVLVVNGFFPSLTIKDILENIANDLLDLSASTGNHHETVNMIEEEMRLIPALRIYLIIHNLDGLMLRNDKAQSVLSRLASIKNIHMIVSIDHINAPLLWNNTKLSNYNFIWFDVTSFLPYMDETAYENSLLINNTGSLELSSMKSVFMSLTSNAKGIYMLLVKYQIKNTSNQNYQGMIFKDLYSACREAFLVSSDIALRAQLTEFLDHKLARMKRGVDGAEYITIPIKNQLLQKFMNEQN